MAEYDTFEDMQDAYFDQRIQEKNAPSLEELAEWFDEDIAFATDGCEVEPDGKCCHGKPSWFLVLGLI